MSDITRLMTLLMSEEKITYILPVNKEDKVLVISPHPDDETLGCGGAIIKMLSFSADVTIVILTDGNGGGRQKDISRMRKEELLKARSFLGYLNFNVLNYPDGELELYQNELSEKIQSILFEYAPKFILTPYLFDRHTDHQSANIALALALENTSQSDIKIGMYEIWTPILNPNCYLNITEEYRKKRLAMDSYKTQENYFGIIDKANALSVFRARQSMRRKVKYMECFKILEIKEYIYLVNTWRDYQYQEKRKRS